MRIAFFLLVLANAAFFAYAWWSGDADANGEAQLIAQQLNPEKMRLLGQTEVGALTRKSEAPKAEPAKAALACLEWGGFGSADAERAAQALAGLQLGAKLTQRRLEDVTGFWVYIPPLANRQAATQKAGELKRMGVDDYFVVPDDPKWRFAISLGVFKTQEAASARLAALRAKGVRSATLGPRDTQPGKTFYQVHDADAALAAKLGDLKQSYPGTELRECPAAEG